MFTDELLPGQPVAIAGHQAVGQAPFLFLGPLLVPAGPQDARICRQAGEFPFTRLIHRRDAITPFTGDLGLVPAQLLA